MQRKAIILSLVLMITALPVFVGAEDISVLKDNFSDFSADVANSLPLNSLIGSEWSDAHIGNLLAVPPHFGVGLAVGATPLPSDSLTDLLDQYGTAPAVLTDGTLDAFGGVPFPGAVLNGRVGGALIPFDVGVKVGMTPAGPLVLGGAGSVEYLLVGADVRVALLKGNLLLPTISVGGGVNYLSGSFTSGTMPDYTLGGVESYDLTVTDPQMTFAWETTTLDLKAQISKTFFFITPYAGVGVTKDLSSRAGGGFEGTLSITDGGSPVSQEEFQQAADQAGYDVDISESGFVLYQKAEGGFIPRLYGGLSLNLLFFRFDVNALYDLNNGVFGVNLGTRFQL